MTLTKEIIRPDSIHTVGLSEFTLNELYLLRGVVHNLEHFGRKFVLEVESEKIYNPAYGLTSEKVIRLATRLDPQTEKPILTREDLASLNSLVAYSLRYADRYATTRKFIPEQLTKLREKLFVKMGYSEKNAKQMIDSGY